MHKKPKLRIKKMPRKMGFQDVIHGHVEPANSTVQVYILANDNKWYLQKPADVKGNCFKCDCSFGFEESFGNSFIAVALLTEDRPGSPLDELPLDIFKSRPVKFKR